MNPLLSKFTSKYEAIPFSAIKVEHFIPALEQTIKELDKVYEQIKKVSDITFESTWEVIEDKGAKLDLIVNIFYGLHSAHCSKELSDISEEFSNILTKHSSSIMLDPRLFEISKDLYDKMDKHHLTSEQQMIVESSYKSFVRNGALLNEEEKDIIKDIDEKLSALGISFGENIRKATNDYLLIVDHIDKLKGMTQDSIDTAAEYATSKGEEGKFAFSLQHPSFYPLLQYCENRELREKVSNAVSLKAVLGELSNQDNVVNILKLRQKRAKLLGYETHAHYVLERRMAQNPETVKLFLADFLEKSKLKGTEEFEKLKTYSGLTDFSKHDSAFYFEKLQKEEIEIDDELLKPYFKLENVIGGVFEIANKLYGIKFEEIFDIEKYHEDVKTFKVTDEDGSYIGLFFGDYFPREEKRPGAWMTNLRGQGLQDGEIKRPFVMNVCNFSKPVGDKPSLLTLNEVLTLFHEFGHGLHGLLANSKYTSKSGTNVMWDFVELPSQIMENWALEKEALDLFATHYETGEKIPAEYVEKIVKSQKFMQGLATLRQTSFGILDITIHSMDPNTISSIVDTENEIMKDLDLYGRIDNQSMLCSFGHLFAGGYAAGYYSYKWAEVLDADAFEAFKEKGIFSKEVGKSFRQNILEKGGTEHPEKLYEQFRGKKPTVDALLTRCGL